MSAAPAVVDGGRGDRPTGVTITAATPDRLDDCVELWTAAVVARDGRQLDGVAERAASRFELPIVSWLVAVDAAARLRGFALVTAPGNSEHPEPPHAALLSLIAVDPESRGRGIGAALLDDATEATASAGHPWIALHVLEANVAAIALYASRGWQPFGEPFEHALQKRPMQTFAREL